MHARAADTGGAFFLSEVEMEQGKVTPLHTHPADESLYVLEGELLIHIDGEEFTLGTGGFTSPLPVCRMPSRSCPPAPGSSASRPPAPARRSTWAPASRWHQAQTTGVVDFDKITESGRVNGGFELVGPPPF